MDNLGIQHSTQFTGWNHVAQDNEIGRRSQVAKTMVLGKKQWYGKQWQGLKTVKLQIQN
jgi:hypothetical protein